MSREAIIAYHMRGSEAGSIEAPFSGGSVLVRAREMREGISIGV